MHWFLEVVKKSYKLIIFPFLSACYQKITYQDNILLIGYHLPDCICQLELHFRLTKSQIKCQITTALTWHLPDRKWKSEI